MDIEYKDVPELMNLFKRFFPKHFHIKFSWAPMNIWDNGTVKRATVINVKVNDTEKGGEGEENWLLSYAYTLLKNPKEMDLCAKRWLDAFVAAKRKATLDILGHKNVTIPLPGELQNNNNKTIQ